MYRQYLLDRFQLHHDRIFDHHVNAILAIELEAFILHRQIYLAPKLKFSQVELVAKALLVGRLQQARPEFTMNFDGRAYYLFR